MAALRRKNQPAVDRGGATGSQPAEPSRDEMAGTDRTEPRQTAPEPAAGGQEPQNAQSADAMSRQDERDDVEEATDVEVPYEEVAVEAYSLYCARGYQDGDDLGDWLAAEQIVRERRRNGPEQG